MPGMPWALRPQSECTSEVQTACATASGFQASRLAEAGHRRVDGLNNGAINGKATLSCVLGFVDNSNFVCVCL